MDNLFCALAIASAAAWVPWGALWLHGMRRVPTLRAEAGDGPPPGCLAIVFAACDEEATVRPAVSSLVRHAPEGSIVVAVNDRSSDATGRILDEVAASDTRLHVVHVSRLPPGWLGKTHALAVGAKRARSLLGPDDSRQWLLFTDADVVFHDNGVEAAWRAAEARAADHLILFPDMVTKGFWESVFVSAFTLLFGIAYRVWDINRPGSSAATGIGAFNMVRVRAYERAGGHRSIAMEVADDVMLGKNLRAAGGKPFLAIGTEVCRVRWQHGLSGLIGGLTKNAFAGFHYSVIRLIGGTLGMLFLTWPFVGVWVGPDWSRWLNAAAILAVFVIFAQGRRHGGASAAYFITYPVGTLLFLVACWRSALLTLVNGGVEWRGTFYPLALLRRSAVPPLDGAEETP